MARGEKSEMVKMSVLMIVMMSSMLMTTSRSVQRAPDVDSEDSEIVRRHLLANGLGVTPPMGSVQLLCLSLALCLAFMFLMMSERSWL